MLLLVAIALVLIGVVTLIVGIFSDTLVWVFVSIGSTVLAGIVLYILYRVGRGTAVTEPAPISPVSEPTAVVPTPAPLREVDEPALASTGFAPASAGSGGSGGAGADEYDFPIAEYDELRVAEILPLLPELDADELVIVRDREESGKARATILARIVELADTAPAPTVTFAPAPAPAMTGAGGGFPIADYDNLKVAEILPLVRRLDADELEEVAAYEEEGANRQTILNLIDNRLAALDGGAPPEPAKQAAPAKKAAPAAKKAAAATKKRAAPSPAAAAPAPAKKASAPAKAPAKKAAAPAKKTAAAPAKKAAGAKKSTAKTAAPVKKTAAPAKKAAKTVKKAGRR